MYKDQRFVVLDIETTGFYFEFFDEAIEIAAIEVINGKKGEVYHEYIKPWKTVTQEITELTGITNEFLQDKPNRWQVLPSLRRFIGDSIVVAYNANFDVDFLNHWFLALDLDVITKHICAFNTFKSITGRKKNAKLFNAAEYYGHVLENAHSAISDTSTTVDVFISELNDNEKIVSNKLEELKSEKIRFEEVATTNDLKTIKDIDFAKVYLLDACEEGLTDEENIKKMLDILPEAYNKAKKEVEQEYSVISYTKRTPREVFIRNKKRILNSRSKKEIKSNLLKAETKKSSRKSIETEEDKNEVKQYFLQGEMFPVISTLTMFDELEIENLFLEWVNSRNVNNYNFLMEEKTVKEVMEILKFATDLEDAYDIHREIFVKKNENKEDVPVNKFLYNLVYKLNFDKKKNTSYHLEDFKVYFESGKTLEEIKKEEPNVELFDLMNLFAEWLLLDDKHKELYRGYISSNILKLEDLKDIATYGLSKYIQNNPEVDKEKALLTNVLYENNFFKI